MFHPTHVCIRDSLAAIEASMAQLHSMKATLDVTKDAIRTSRTLLAAKIPDRGAAIVNGKRIDAKRRIAIRLIEALRGAGYECELCPFTLH